MDKNLTEIILAVIALFGAAGLCFKFVSNRSKKSVTQNNNKVGGDMAGGNINKKNS